MYYQGRVYIEYKTWSGKTPPRDKTEIILSDPEQSLTTKYISNQKKEKPQIIQE
jgi:hypothetical protein